MDARRIGLWQVLAEGLKFGVLAFCAGLLSAGISSGFFNLLGLDLHPQDSVQTLMNAETPARVVVLIVVASVAVSPLLEEWFFRHLALGGLVRLSGRKALSTIAVGVFFAACHFNLLAFLPLFVASLFFSAAYFRLGLQCAVVSHAVYNIVTVALAIFQNQ